MSQNTRIVASIPTTHYNWLKEVQQRKGLNTIPDVVRDLIVTAYEKDKIKEVKKT